MEIALLATCAAILCGFLFGVALCEWASIYINAKVFLAQRKELAKLRALVNKSRRDGKPVPPKEAGEQ